VPRAGTSRRAAGSWALLYAHNQLAFGLRRGAFTVWFAEDVTPGHVYGPDGPDHFMSNAPDFTLGLTWRHAL
jgi:hypothetical protein